MKTQVLDCTLRDGGYYGNWDFDESTVRKYLAAVSTAKIDIIEIGYRSLMHERFLGPFAYSTDEYLKTLPLPQSVEIAVMVNAKELIDFDVDIEKTINKLFSQKSESPVDIIRIAVYAKDIKKCYSITKNLNALGYRIFINVMQVGFLETEKITEIARIVSDWNTVEVLYFADSFGNMGPGEVKKIKSALSLEWKGPIGMHAHDNKGQALMNCIAALESGINYLDSTLLGMGRGAGNVKTENLLLELTQRDFGEYFPDALFPLVMQEFRALQEQFGWGPNICYFLSAVYGIHPTYIQEMLGDERYGTEQILSAINFLKSTKAPFYNFENMLRAISGMTGSEHGTWDATGWVRNRSVLIIGSGPGTNRHLRAIKNYIDRENPVVLCLNINETVPEELVTAYVACHETRILIECDHYANLKKPLILPLSRVPDAIKDTLKDTDIMDYGMRIEEGGLQIKDSGCVMQSPLALIYAISIATAGGANKILLSGVDGFELSDPRQKEMVSMLELYAQLHNALTIQGITPTTYPVEQRSVYEPGL